MSSPSASSGRRGRSGCRRAAAIVAAALAGIAAPAGLARAQGGGGDGEAPGLPDDGAAGAATAGSESTADADASFGPLLTIEAIEIEGNDATAERVIRRVLPIQPGEMLRAGDPRLQAARYKLLALGFFRGVELRLRRGSERGGVILVVQVVERGTVVLNRLYFGSSSASPWWVGADVGERNFIGTGLAVGAGFVYAAAGDIAGADDQWAGELRIAAPTVGSHDFGLHLQGSWVDASEPYRVSGDPADNVASDFRAFDYRRAGLRGGATFQLGGVARLTVDGRAEWVDAELPTAPTRELPDGTIAPLSLDLEPGASRVVTGALGFDRDTRPDPVLPYAGDRLQLLGELGSTLLGGSYDYATLLARYQHWWPVAGPRHVVSMHLTGGVVLGDAPRFDRLHVADLNRLLTPRALGLVVATTPSHDLLGTSTEDLSYGEVGGSAVVEYSYQLFRSRRGIYGGDLFVGAGLWVLSSADRLRARDTSLYRSLPIDLLVDAGLRIDTEIGIFELTFANALGRVPL